MNDSDDGKKTNPGVVLRTTPKDSVEHLVRNMKELGGKSGLEYLLKKVEHDRIPLSVMPMLSESLHAYFKAHPLRDDDEKSVATTLTDLLNQRLRASREASTGENRRSKVRPDTANMRTVSPHHDFSNSEEEPATAEIPWDGMNLEHVPEDDEPLGSVITDDEWREETKTPAPVEPGDLEVLCQQINKQQSDLKHRESMLWEEMNRLDMQRTLLAQQQAEFDAQCVSRREALNDELAAIRLDEQRRLDDLRDEQREALDRELRDMRDAAERELVERQQSLNAWFEDANATLVARENALTLEAEEVNIEQRALVKREEIVAMREAKMAAREESIARTRTDLQTRLTTLDERVFAIQRSERDYEDSIKELHEEWKDLHEQKKIFDHEKAKFEAMVTGFSTQESLFMDEQAVFRASLEARRQEAEKLIAENAIDELQRLHVKLKNLQTECDEELVRRRAECDAELTLARRAHEARVSEVNKEFDQRSRTIEFRLTHIEQQEADLRQREVEAHDREQSFLMREVGVAARESQCVDVQSALISSKEAIDRQLLVLDGREQALNSREAVTLQWEDELAAREERIAQMEKDHATFMEVSKRELHIWRRDVYDQLADTAERQQRVLSRMQAAAVHDAEYAGKAVIAAAERTAESIVTAAKAEAQRLNTVVRSSKVTPVKQPARRQSRPSKSTRGITRVERGAIIGFGLMVAGLVVWLLVFV